LCWEARGEGGSALGEGHALREPRERRLAPIQRDLLAFLQIIDGERTDKDITIGLPDCGTVSWGGNRKDCLRLGLLFQTIAKVRGRKDKNQPPLGTGAGQSRW